MSSENDERMLSFGACVVKNDAMSASVYYILWLSFWSGNILHYNYLRVNYQIAERERSLEVILEYLLIQWIYYKGLVDSFNIKDYFHWFYKQ